MKDVIALFEVAQSFDAEPYKTILFAIGIIMLIDTRLVRIKDILLFAGQIIKVFAVNARSVFFLISANLRDLMNYIEPPSARAVRVAAWIDLLLTTLFTGYFFVYGFLVSVMAILKMAAPDVTLVPCFILLALGVSIMAVGYVYRATAYKIAKTKGVNLYPWRQSA